MGKQNVVCPHNGMLFICKKEWIPLGWILPKTQKIKGSGEDVQIQTLGALLMGM